MIDETTGLTEVEIISDYSINKLYESICMILVDKKVTTINIVMIATNLMQIVEKYPKISGIQKKSLVIQVLKKFVIDQSDGDTENALLLFIDTFLPSVIDTIISVDVKDIVINIKKGVKSFFICC